MTIYGQTHSSFAFSLRPSLSTARGYATFRLRSGFFFLFNFLILVFALLTVFAPFRILTLYPLKRLTSFYSPYNIRPLKILVSFRRRVRFFKTVQRGPMAHRQWSQEQFRFFYYTSSVFVSLDTPPTALTDNSVAFFFSSIPYFFSYHTTLVSFFRVLFRRSFFLRISVL